jgi:alpha-tubulin suppressor-like RCC1 family protein
LGQLGLGHNYNQNVPTLIEAPKMGEIIAISAGGHHSLFLNAQGQVFACGSNNYGQLGFGNVKDRNFPKLIETFHADNKKVYQIPIVAISAGVQHSLLLDSYGQVWSFGRGDNGQLGLESKKETHTPTSITRLVMGEEIPVPFIAISAGDSHSLISDSQGRVFSLGESNDG